ncbi:MAG: transposase [Candidatus Atribacteria bacterium]|nr:transposase [Candidatus Atribacteria bacterium]
MELWISWFEGVLALRPACGRKRTFLWMTLVLVGFSIRGDLLGVTSFIRACFLEDTKYRRLLHFFHSPALHLQTLTALWVQLAFRWFSPVTFGGYALLIADGLKVPKEGKKMPAVKSLHQESENNSKAAFIMGHSLQAIGLLVHGSVGQFFCVPLASRIHEGLVWSNRDQRTLLDKLVGLFLEIVAFLPQKSLLIADAYYASKKVIQPLLRGGHHLVTRVRITTRAYHQAPPAKNPKPGRPKFYGKKVLLRDYFKRPQDFVTALSPVYGETNVWIQYLCLDLLWRPVGQRVRFVLVKHPTRGRMILMTTLTLLAPLDLLRLYGYRFKIEVSFKQALHTLGTYAYHFWMKAMPPLRKGSGNQYLHRETEPYRQQIKRKVAAYHRYIQLGCIAQGLLQYLSVTFGKTVWRCFGSWLRTMNQDKAPSEMVVAQALRASLPQFLVVKHGSHDLEKFIVENADVSRMPELRLIG